MKIDEIRQCFRNRKMNSYPVTISLPGLEMLDGQLSIVELPMPVIKQARALAQTRDGVDEVLASAAFVAKSLVSTETGERVWNDNEIEEIANDWGTTVLKPLAELAVSASGLNDQAVEIAKKN